MSRNMRAYLLWISIIAAALLIVGFFGIHALTAKSATQDTDGNRDFPMPMTETLIAAIRQDMTGDTSVYESVIEFADRSDSLVASYDPGYPYNVKFTGSGYSSTETKYEFTIYLVHSTTNHTWEMGFWDWEKIQ